MTIIVSTDKGLKTIVPKFLNMQYKRNFKSIKALLSKILLGFKLAQSAVKRQIQWKINQLLKVKAYINHKCVYTVYCIHSLVLNISSRNNLRHDSATPQTSDQR